MKEKLRVLGKKGGKTDTTSIQRGSIDLAITDLAHEGQSDYITQAQRTTEDIAIIQRSMDNDAELAKTLIEALQSPANMAETAKERKVPKKQRSAYEKLLKGQGLGKRKGKGRGKSLKGKMANRSKATHKKNGFGIGERFVSSPDSSPSPTKYSPDDRLTHRRAPSAISPQYKAGVFL